MTDIDVELDDLRTISTVLGDRATTLQGIQVPDGPDAGIVSAVITSLLGQLTTSVGNIASSLTAASESVGRAREYYQLADAEASATLEEIDAAMEDQ
ncbi:hypothetical protein C8046_09540 [Serinibacter arcticus]|uniref:Excreted virulence factor EspC, type VII ESX diderm n=1 Tax=Serinibacter arcticus TaxID=1655435 RepID=A0A2U1ZV37_9MICO|nr:hypothetical protein [Serinibacter arcticus]PWD50857.1 hypothetical protein C8046_09540 [Serinibacter arcticus]